MRPNRALVYFVSALILALGGSLPLGAQLRIDPADLRIDQSTEGGYIIRIRAEGIGSVLLTESTEDPAWEEASYAFRNPQFHPLNGDEPRLLDGDFLPTGPGNYFIIDSTPEPDSELGQSFRLFIPYIVDFGYPWTRNGQVQVLDGTYLSIRTFERPYADYSGGFLDNPFILRVVQLPPPPPEEEPEEEVAFMEATVEAFTKASDETEARVLAADNSEELPSLIEEIMDELDGETLDLILVLDTTQSMTNSLNVVRRDLVKTLQPYTGRFQTLRIGFVVFRDYFDEYLNRPSPIQNRLEDIQPYLDRARAYGGRDIPEAVYEALYTALTHYEWEAEEREIILIGDAPPHPIPRGPITEERVYELARELDVRINTIMLPHP